MGICCGREQSLRSGGRRDQRILYSREDGVEVIPVHSGRVDPGQGSSRRLWNLAALSRSFQTMRTSFRFQLFRAGSACGVIFGPYCADIFNPRSWGGDLNAVTLEVMRITLAAGLFAIGVELPQSYLADHAKGLLVMVVPTMAFGWLVVAGMNFHIETCKIQLLMSLF